jgi:hypothetical protein
MGSTGGTDHLQIVMAKMTQLGRAIAGLLIACLTSNADAQGLPPLAHLTVGSASKYTADASYLDALKYLADLQREARFVISRSPDPANDRSTSSKNARACGDLDRWHSPLFCATRTHRQGPGTSRSGPLDLCRTAMNEKGRERQNGQEAGIRTEP